MPPETPIIETIKKTISTAAVTEVPAPLPQIPASETGIVTYGLGGAVMTALGALLWLRRRVPHDNLEISKDRTEGSLLETLRKERDAAVARADALQTQRVVDAGIIAGLEERNKYQAQELARVNLAMEKLGQEFDKLKDVVRNLNHQANKPIPTKAGEGPASTY